MDCQVSDNDPLYGFFVCDVPQRGQVLRLLHDILENFVRVFQRFIRCLLLLVASEASDAFKK